MPTTSPTTSLLDAIVTGRRAKPRRVLLYGTHGIGKSTFGAMAEAPIFIPCEDGLADIDCASFPLCHSVGDAIGCMEARHTHAAQLREEGVDVGIISRQLGHRSLMTTIQYLNHIQPTAVVDAMKGRVWAAG